MFAGPSVVAFQTCLNTASSITALLTMCSRWHSTITCETVPCAPIRVQEMTSQRCCSGSIVSARPVIFHQKKHYESNATGYTSYSPFFAQGIEIPHARVLSLLSDTLAILNRPDFARSVDPSIDSLLAELLFLLNQHDPIEVHHHLEALRSHPQELAREGAQRGPRTANYQPGASCVECVPSQHGFGWNAIRTPRCLLGVCFQRPSL